MKEFIVEACAGLRIDGSKHPEPCPFFRSTPHFRCEDPLNLSSPFEIEPHVAFMEIDPRCTRPDVPVTSWPEKN